MTDWPNELEVTLDGIAQGGEGVGRWQGRVIFAHGGLPGERVKVRLHERRAAYAHGDATEILEASPDRVAPQLPGAGWMPWQHIAYAAQLRFKRQILADQLAKIAGLSDPAIVAEETIPASPPWAYRNSVHVHSDGERLGYYATGSRDLLEVAEDPLLQPALNQALAALRDSLGAAAMPRGEITIRVSESYGYSLAVLRLLEDLPIEEQRALAVAWREYCPALAGVSVLSRPPALLGADHLVEELGSLVFHLSPLTFFQVNRAAAETLIRTVRTHMDAGGRLLDLYCGAGAFALSLANQYEEILGVEENAPAIADARASAEMNKIANARFEVGQVERVLQRVEGAFDTVLLDPPRRGCHPQALAGIVRLAPARIIYVSCHPATLARDLKELVSGGYRVLSAQPVDLFPQTPHIESVCVLDRV